MTPKAERLSDAVTLYEGEALVVLASLEAGSVQAVVTDPPFGVRSEDWDDMSEQEFSRFTMAWLAESRRICDTLVSFFASGMPFFKLCEFIYPRCRQLIWHKPLGSQYAGASESRMWFAYEPIAHCYAKDRWEVVQPKEQAVARLLREAREKARLSRGAVDMAIRGKKTGLCFRWEESACLPSEEQIRKLKSILPLNGEFETAIEAAYVAKKSVLAQMADKSSGNAAEKTDVFSFRTLTSSPHPCAKPVGLIADLIRCTTQPGETILDPFAGSGTTAIAAMQEGRSCILIERDPAYCEIIRRRVAQADGAAPGTLFREVARRESLFADEPEPEAAR